MKLIKPPVNKELPRSYWTGKQFTCEKCEAVYEIESQDKIKQDFQYMMWDCPTSGCRKENWVAIKNKDRELAFNPRAASDAVAKEVTRGWFDRIINGK